MRKKLLLGNWKMNKTASEAKAFALASKDMVAFAVAHGVDVGVAPTFVGLQAVVDNASKDLIVAATGEPLNPRHYANYLTNKYTALYNIR